MTKQATDKVAIFDLDGVLINPVFRLHILKKLFDELPGKNSGIPDDLLKQLSDKTQERISQLGENEIVTDNLTVLSAQLLEEAGIPGDDVKTYHSTIRNELKTALVAEEYQQIIQQHSRLLPGVNELVKVYRAWGFKTAVVTNQYDATAKGQLEQLGIAQLFDVIQGNSGEGSKEAGFKTPRKPNPKVTQEVLAQLGTAQNATILFHGDSIRDLLLNPDGRQRRIVADDKLRDARDKGVKGYRNFKVILLSPEVEQKIVFAMTSQERTDFNTAQKNSGELGKRLGWVSDAGALLAKFDQIILAEIARNNSPDIPPRT